MIIVGNFLNNFDAMRNHFDWLAYDGITNPADGVFYPGVTTDIPEVVRQEVVEKVQSLMGQQVTMNSMFLRLSTEGTYAPHQAHTDALMGQLSLMLYLNREEDCQGGTSFLMHEDGMSSTPNNTAELETWENDHSNPDKWEAVSLCEMEPNRACIFDANLMHRAEPVGGFGEGPADGRLVLTMFFDL